MRTYRMAVAAACWALGCGPLLAQYQPYQQTAPQPVQGGYQPYHQPAAAGGLPGQPEAVAAQPYAFPYNAQAGGVEPTWCGGNPVGGCNGPVGANGPITYELYGRTGPNILAGVDGFRGALDNGWTVQGGGRSLFFNTERDAAWVVDLGLGYTRNQGRRLDAPVLVAPSALKFGGVNDNTPQPLGIRFLNRTSFNYGLGRDWFLNGPGAVGEEAFGNWRFGVDVLGRYGTASVGFEPANDVGGSRRRQGIFHGVAVAGQMNWEKRFGGAVLFVGGRVEWGYEWTNLLPPNAADIRDVNLLGQIGVRY